ncbi:MAG: 1-acyl-sn-glycerol-3-phosphate acyltransferase [Anaerolineae bacterium]|nr:MAG: 1-acyl-sn-glycerol-3-phosphate acyltransferase [Anaerolineae bacterium]
MTTQAPPKPISEIWRPELTRLPELTPARRLFRHLARAIVRPLVAFWLKPQVTGLENFPRQGPAILVSNHLGDADALLMFSYLPVFVDALAKIELYDIPFVGPFMDAYGVIWVHRGRPDRRAISAALEGLRRGRIIAIAPEGRESLTGGLEKGTDGAAFLALKADVPLVPVVVTGTENKRIYEGLRRLKRLPTTMTVGEPFRLQHLPDRREAIRQGTEHIMRTLARMLPEHYRGVYRDVV